MSNEIDCFLDCLFTHTLSYIATKKLSYSSRITKTLSPTEKNEIFNLAHLALRLLLYMVQKISSPSGINHIVRDTTICLIELMFDDDVPMDTKSVCGILYLNMQLLENGADTWMNVSISCK